MKKIPTLFVRDPEDMRRVTREVHPDCQWVLDGEGVATRKYDGTCVFHDPEAHQWWARREVKPGKPQPAYYWALETDPATGKTVGWEPIVQSAFAKAFLSVEDKPDEFGTYELIGPKVNGNPEGMVGHALVRHGINEFPAASVPRDYDGLRELLTATNFRYEGIVWHHPDGRMAKLKRRDFPQVAP